MRDVHHVKLCCNMFLYIASAFDMIKVGLSSTPELRTNAIYGQLLHSVEVPSDRAADAEAYTHAALKEWEKSAEWFGCTSERAIEAVEDTVRRLGAGLSLATPGDLGRANRNRGILLASQRRAKLTAGKLKDALPDWLADELSVRAIAKKHGISIRTLYHHLPPRTLAQEEAAHGKRHA